jgi:hypothetical protein
MGGKLGFSSGQLAAEFDVVSDTDHPLKGRLASRVFDMGFGFTL